MQVRGEGKEAEIWVEAPRQSGADSTVEESARKWELVDIRGVSEGELRWSSFTVLIASDQGRIRRPTRAIALFAEH